MPSYEPTPRRFSVITVSRSASRRNSIDEPSNPVLANAPPPTPSYSSAIDLAAALKQLQHSDDGDQRGRSREVAGERAIRSTWGHDEPIKVPSARRESSASTRDRIAMWEERNRSQSKGRSKSRGRDLGAGSRVSIVPEVPELVAALAQLESKHQGATSENTVSREEEKDQLPTEAVTEDDRDKATLAHLNLDSTEALELTEDPWQSEEVVIATPPLEVDLDAPSTDSEEEQEGVNQASHTTKAADQASNLPPAPRTPIRISPEQLPTPSTTPQAQILEAGNPATPSSSGNLGNEKLHTEPAQSLDFPQRPSTPVQAQVIPEPPLTPEDTPAQLKRSRSPVVLTFGDELSSSSPHTAVPTTATNGIPDSPLAEPSYRPVNKIKDKDWDDDVKGEDFHLTPDVLPDAAAPRPAAQSTEQVVLSKTKLEPLSSRDQQRQLEPLGPTADEAASQYHNVWRIQGYEPEFPLPSKPSAVDVETQRLAKADFSGNPLRELPRSQLSAVAEPFKPLEKAVPKPAPNPYPYAQNGPNSRGDFSVHIPPSPTTTYVPGEYGTRQPRQRSRNREAARESRDRYTSRNAPVKHEWDAPPVIERALHAASVSVIQGLTVPVELYRGLRDSYYPPPGRPDVVKAYPARRRLPVRIFFPTHHDLTSPALLPTLFTIHGGGFTVGSSTDDDAWNRGFSDDYTVLVISLNYSKAPWAVFPAPLLDVEALYHAVLNDESLPIDRMRTAILGFDAGGNLALGLSQLPSVKTGYDPTRHPHHERDYASQPYPPAHQPPRSHPPPAAVISVCGILDFTMSAARKARTRPYKRQLRGPRGWGPGLDWMAKLLPSSAWSYIPYGHDTSDPYLSPAYASRADLPPHLFVIGAELDCLAHESWRTACAWGGRAVPDTDVLVGRRGPSRWRGCLDDGRGENAAKFAWKVRHEESGNGGFEGTTRWLLVPDVVHGFDSAGWRSKYLLADEEARMDSEMKTIAYQREVAEWLWGTAWR